MFDRRKFWANEEEVCGNNGGLGEVLLQGL